MNSRPSNWWILLMILCLWSAPEGRSQLRTISFDTSTATGWTVTAGAYVNVVPFQITYNSIWNPGPKPYLSVSSTGNSEGTFLHGENLTNFDGFWIADYRFFLPSNAVKATLNYSNFFVDDRAVLTLNGTTADATGINTNQFTVTSGPSMVLTDGGPLQPYSFSLPNGSVFGSVTNGFNLGGENVVEVIVNNTDNGVYDQNRSLEGGDQTLLGLSGTITYSVPEPQTMSLMLLGFLGLRAARMGSLARSCKKSLRLKTLGTGQQKKRRICLH